MSDFDAALERLVTDPSFAASLAADPAAALAGYRLAADEVELLSAQVSGDAGGHRTVEERTSKASMFGLLAPLAGAAGIGSAMPGSHAGLGHAPTDVGHAGFGGAAAQAGAAGSGGTGGSGGLVAGGLAAAGFGGADPIGQAMTGQGMTGQGMTGQPGAVAGMGDGLTGGGALGSTLSGGPEELIGQRLTDLGPGGGGASAGFGTAELPPVTDYHTRVDVNGDGHWDKHTYVRRADGGVDILADMNHDGRADFVGHDYDRDGLVDAADYDKNRDGVFETHMFDDNRDGWMDRTIRSPEPPPPSH